MPRLVKTQTEMEGRYEDVWVYVDEDELEPWPAERAFDALGTHTRLSDLVTITRTVALAAAEARKATWTDADKVKAQYKDGVLTVTLPKTEEAKPKHIDVSVS